MLSGGQLTQRVTFRRQAIRTADGGGGAAVTWAGLCTVWGRVRYEKGRERLEHDRVAAAMAGILTVRSSSETRAVTTADIVMIDDEPHAIRSIADPDGRREQIEMVVEKGVAL